MTTRIISVNCKYRYKVDLEWKYVPKVRSYDIIGISIESNVKIASDIYFQQITVIQRRIVRVVL